jgi:hypothetical protein
MFHTDKKRISFKFICTNLFYVPVSEHLSFAKIIHPADRCGITKIWLNSMIITQVHLVLGKIKCYLNVQFCHTTHSHYCLGKLFANVNDVNRVPHASGGVVVWAGISYGQRTQLDFIDGNFNAQRYRYKFLRPIVMSRHSSAAITSCISMISIFFSFSDLKHVQILNLDQYI